jgi:DNA repair ATPase RecN
VKSVLTESKYKQQRNKVNNLKKQAKKKFYANINENLDELKLANGKLVISYNYLPCRNAYTSYFQKY